MYQIFEYLYSVINLVTKFCRKIKCINIFKFFSTIIFIHQTIHLTIDYLKYETVIDLKLLGEVRPFETYSPSNPYHPAISLCLKSWRFYSAQNESSLILDRIGKIDCILGRIVTNGRKNLEYSSEMNKFF
jgi:hypothetical protein